MNEVVRLLPAEEEAILRCYVNGSNERPSFQQLYDEMGVPASDNISTSRLQVAVAQILLHHVQDKLPQWAAVSSGTVLLNRRKHRRHKHGLLPFHPQPLFSINWATSGPGYEWPEEYRVTYLPGFGKYVFTASRDGSDVFGCADHAIGIADEGDDIEEAARKVITAHWRMQAESWGQQRWEYSFGEELIDDRTVVAWADEVWPADGAPVQHT